MTSPDGFAVFCGREFPRLVRMLDLYVGDLAVAEELGQETLMRAAQHWSRVSELESPGGWCYRVAMNLANSHFRRLRAEKRARTRMTSVEDTTDHNDLAVALTVRRAVDALPARERAAVVLRYFLDLSVRDTARVMRCSEDAVRSVTKRAVKRLQDRLAELGMTEVEADA